MAQNIIMSRCKKTNAPQVCVDACSVCILFAWTCSAQKQCNRTNHTAPTIHWQKTRKHEVKAHFLRGKWLHTNTVLYTCAMRDKCKRFYKNNIEETMAWDQILWRVLGDPFCVFWNMEVRKGNQKSNPPWPVVKLGRLLYASFSLDSCHVRQMEPWERGSCSLPLGLNPWVLLQNWHCRVNDQRKLCPNVNGTLYQNWIWVFVWRTCFVRLDVRSFVPTSTYFVHFRPCFWDMSSPSPPQDCRSLPDKSWCGTAT